jgi:hypothetical protein
MEQGQLMDLLERSAAHYENIPGSTTMYRDVLALLKEIKAETVRTMQEILKDRIASLEYYAKSQRKTIEFDRLREQVNWVLHEVVPATIDEVAALLLKEVRECAQ